jgi:hypothetical protein
VLRAAAQSTLNNTGGVATGTTTGPSAALSHPVTDPGHQHGLTQPTFTGSATSVLQPYLVVYCWERTL